MTAPKLTPMTDQPEHERREFSGEDAARAALQRRGSMVRTAAWGGGIIVLAFGLESLAGDGGLPIAIGIALIVWGAAQTVIAGLSGA